MQTGRFSALTIITVQIIVVIVSLIFILILAISVMYGYFTSAEKNVLLKSLSSL